MLSFVIDLSRPVSVGRRTRFILHAPSWMVTVCPVRHPITKGGSSSSFKSRASHFSWLSPSIFPISMHKCHGLRAASVHGLFRSRDISYMQLQALRHKPSCSTPSENPQQSVSSHRLSPSSLNGIQMTPPPVLSFLPPQWMGN